MPSLHRAARQRETLPWQLRSVPTLVTSALDDRGELVHHGRMRKMLVLCGVVGVALGGCVPPPPFHPVSVSAPEDAYARALRGLVSAGNAVETGDEKSGVITTKWEEIGLGGDGFMRVRWTVIASAGKLTISSQCQVQVRGGDPFMDHSWMQCSSQPADRQGQAQQLADAIVQR